MLQVDIRELARGPVDTGGELAGNDPLFVGLDFVLAGPVRVRGRVQAAGEGRFYWHGGLSAQGTEQCPPGPGPVAGARESEAGNRVNPASEGRRAPEPHSPCRESALFTGT